MHYTLRQLQVFMAIARLENVTRAAEALSMSQSAASSALKELENQYDIKLFDRAGKRIRLNEHGRQLRPQVEALLAQADALEHTLAAHNTPGTLQVGATLTIGNYLAVELMAEYMAVESNARVELTVANTQSIVDQVLHFDLDVGLVEGELNHPDLNVTEWMDDNLVIFTRPNDTSITDHALSDAELQSLPWIVREPGSGTRQGFDRAMAGLINKTNIRLELQHTEAIKRAVQAGLGVGCLSEISIKEDIERGQLKPLHAPHRNWQRKFYFVLHKQKFESPGVAAWLDLCRKYATQPV